MAGYGDDASFTAWLAANGYSLPSSAPSKAVLLQRGSDYIDGTYGARFPGVPSDGIAQERAWPRTGATIYGSTIAPGDIPVQIKNAAFLAAYLEAKTPGSLSTFTDPSKRVKRQKVGEIEREFFGSDTATVAGSAAPVSSIIEGLLAPLLTSASALPAIMVV